MCCDRSLTDKQAVSQQPVCFYSIKAHKHSDNGKCRQQPEEPNSPGINKLIRANVDKCVAVVMVQCGGTQATVSHTMQNNCTWSYFQHSLHKKWTFYPTGVQHKLTEEPIQPHIWPGRKSRTSTQRRDGGRRNASSGSSVRVKRDKTRGRRCCSVRVLLELLDFHEKASLVLHQE